MPTRMHNIDALRAIAALTVLFQHVSGDIWRAFPASLPYLKPVALDLFDWGRFGVVLFFLISGYVIPLSFTGPSPLQKFVISRIFRLYPAFWLSIVAMVGALHLNGVNLLPTQIAANVTMAYPLFGQAAINGVFWTLIIEVMFYITCFILFAAGQLESPKVVGALALLGIMSVVGPSVILGRQTLPLHGYFLSFLLLGSLIRQTHARLPHAKQLACLVAFAIIAALPIVSSLNAGRPTAFSYSTDMGVALSIIAAGALFIASWSPVFSSLPRFLLELGAWSFSIYLLHVPVSLLVEHFFHPDSLATASAFFVVTCALSIAVAAVSFEMIERPFIRLGHRLANALAPKAYGVPSTGGNG